MEKSKLETLIKYLQCKQATFANKVSDKLSLGICSDEYLDKLVITSYLLEIFYRMDSCAVDPDNNCLYPEQCLTLCEYSNIKDKFMLLIK